MAYRSVFVFDDGGDWTSDWKDVVDFRLLAGRGRGGFGLFTRLDHSYQGETPPNRWRGMNNTLTIVREDNEELKDLFNVVNAPPLGEPIYQIIRTQAEAASRRLPQLVNVFFQPPIRFSYAYGSYAVGPGKDQPLLTIKVSLHINTPPGASSIDAAIVYYVALHIENGHVATELIGSAHPWRFHGDGYDAYQDEINLGLEDAANNAIQGLNSFLELIRAYRGRELYLIPGRAVPTRQPEGHALRGSVRSAMTLALLP